MLIAAAHFSTSCATATSRGVRNPPWWWRGYCNRLPPPNTPPLEPAEGWGTGAPVSGDYHMRTVIGANHGWRMPHPPYWTVRPRPSPQLPPHLRPRQPYFRPGVRQPPPKPADFRSWTYAVSQPPPHFDRFTVLSYNILADYLAMEHRSRLYFHIPHHILDWEWRKRRLFIEFGLWSPDIMCLQEVDRFHDLDEELAIRGYRGIWKMRTGNAVDGCAIFWRTNKFQLHHEEHIEFCKIGLRDNIAQICVLESKEQKPGGSMAASLPAISKRPKFLIVCNTHVLYNPKRGEIKLGQVRVLLHRAYEVSKVWDDAPVIICGDFNCTPKSPLYNFISEQKINLSGLARDEVSGQYSSGVKRATHFSYPGSERVQPLVNNSSKVSSGVDQSVDCPATIQHCQTTSKVRDVPSSGNNQSQSNNCVPEMQERSATDSQCSNGNNFKSNYHLMDIGCNQVEFASAVPSHNDPISGVIQRMHSDIVNINEDGSFGIDSFYKNKIEEVSHGFTKPSVQFSLNSDLSSSTSMINQDPCSQENGKKERAGAQILSDNATSCIGNFHFHSTSRKDRDKEVLPDGELLDNAVTEIPTLEIISEMSAATAGTPVLEAPNNSLENFLVEDEKGYINDMHKTNPLDLCTTCESSTGHKLGDASLRADEKYKDGSFSKLSNEFLVPSQENVMPVAINCHEKSAEKEDEQTRKGSGKFPLIGPHSVELLENNNDSGKANFLADAICGSEENGDPNFFKELIGSEAERIYVEETFFDTPSEQALSSFEAEGPSLIVSQPVNVNEKSAYNPFLWTPMEIEMASGNAECCLAEHQIKLKSAYSDVEDIAGTKDSNREPQVTSYNRQFMGTVDYIWYSEGLQTVRVLDTIPWHILRGTPGFPTQKWGSDHLALACEFALTKDFETAN